jgi:hypothetical protein
MYERPLVALEHGPKMRFVAVAACQRCRARSLTSPPSQRCICTWRMACSRPLASCACRLLCVLSPRPHFIQRLPIDARPFPLFLATPKSCTHQQVPLDFAHIFTAEFEHLRKEYPLDRVVASGGRQFHPTPHTTHHTLACLCEALQRRVTVSRAGRHRPRRGGGRVHALDYQFVL